MIAMIRTGDIETWAANPAEMGPLYPFVGWEVAFLVMCVALWLAWTVWQMARESTDYADQDKKLKEPGELDKYLSATAPDVLLVEDDEP